MDYVNALEARMSKETKGISVLPGVIDLINSIPSEDWTVNTAGTMTMATARLTQFNIKVPNEMMTGCRVCESDFVNMSYLYAILFYSLLTTD